MRTTTEVSGHDVKQTGRRIALAPKGELRELAAAAGLSFSGAEGDLRRSELDSSSLSEVHTTSS